MPAWLNPDIAVWVLVALAGALIILPRIPYAAIAASFSKLPRPSLPGLATTAQPAPPGDAHDVAERSAFEAVQNIERVLAENGVTEAERKELLAKILPMLVGLTKLDSPGAAT